MPVIDFQTKYFFCSKTKKISKEQNELVVMNLGMSKVTCTLPLLLFLPCPWLCAYLIPGICSFPTLDSNSRDFLRMSFLLDQSISQGTVTHKFSKNRSEHLGIWPSSGPHSHLESHPALSAVAHFAGRSTSIPGAAGDHRTAAGGIDAGASFMPSWW